MFSTPTRQRLAWFVIGCLSFVAVALVLFTIFRSAEDSRRNGEVLERVKSCTTPGEPCFERGQRQTADAVADINRITLYAAACADQPRVQTVPEIQQCVIARLSADQELAPE